MTDALYGDGQERVNLWLAFFLFAVFESLLFR
jgi:hypothetical protein